MNGEGSSESAEPPAKRPKPDDAKPLVGLLLC